MANKNSHQDEDARQDTYPDLSDPSLFLNRELTWLAFNQRVLNEALDSRIPLLERVKFAAIAGSNLDEFFMKRIGGLKQQVGAGIHEETVDGRSPREQIDACYAFVREHHREREVLLEGLWTELAGVGIEITSYKKLDENEQALVRHDYYNNIFPLVTPQSIDPAHPFPFISNLSLNLLVTLRYPQEKATSLARVKLPISAGAPRFVQVIKQQRYVFLEDVMANNLDMLFPGMEILNCELFRVTRNANTSRNEEHADDLLALIESTLQDRKFSPIVRLQVHPDMDSVHRGRLAAELGLNEETDVFEVSGMMGMRDLWQLANLDLPKLKDPVHHPVDHPALESKRNIFHVIRDSRAILLQHPYESFSSSVERFLGEAAIDPKVRAIKMTLYRTSPQSPIVDTLIRAAQNGKQVAVVVELKARFDEEANIRLANRMEEAGIHATYGVVGLKTHCKLILVLRQDYKGLRRYVHIGTGNYHPVTARLYSDLGLFVYDKDIGQDATELFNYLTTGYTPKRNYNKLLPAPKHLKKALISKIEREITKHTKERPGRIIFKMNALEDPDICIALYRASIAGVRVDLIVRDSCRVRPGVQGISETMRVISIVGRFLEHARIYYFQNAGDEEFYIGSADAMRRNLEHRVEVVAPIESRQLRQDLLDMLEIQLSDQRSAWEMQSNGTYAQRQPDENGDARSSQEVQIEQAEKRFHDAKRLRSRKAKSFGKRNLR
ncbi:MAG: polyphosphate kinase 1 [Deltaproteobacteria bacterium]|jgi:polyphosphate kinase|nr:polyphosphate kinase 1 [Deltaproteobacteria bacterium]